MIAKNKAAHVAKIVRKHKDKLYTSYLLRRSFREDGKVKHETLANLSHLPEEIIQLIDRALKGETLLPIESRFALGTSLPHGHVLAVLTMIKKLGIADLLATKPSRERTLAVAMIAERVLFPCSKLAATRNWCSTTLGTELGVADADVNELYAAMDWLLTRKKDVEKKLAARHLCEGSCVLYDVSSSYYEGLTCDLAQFGHGRDGKRGLPIIVYGVLSDQQGRPVSIEAYPGNTADPTTVPDHVEKLRGRFRLSRVVVAGDRGMLTQTQIKLLKTYPGLGWISALRSEAIRELVQRGHLERSLFDQRDLAEISSPAFPGERLVACFNPLLAERRSQKREELLAATEQALGKLQADVNRRTKKPLKATDIALRAGKVVGRWKMAKHFELTIDDGSFAWARSEESIRRESELDGIYVVRTSERKRALSAEDAVRTYKELANVERVFRGLKGIDLLVRPIHHRVEPRVKAHLLLCLLAYYVQWHLRQAWKPLLFDDEELAADRRTRDPVKPAQPSDSAQAKKKTLRTTKGDLPLHSFRTLLAHLGSQARCAVKVTTDAGVHTYDQAAAADPVQAEALRLIQEYAVAT